MLISLLVSMNKTHLESPSILSIEANLSFLSSYYQGDNESQLTVKWIIDMADCCLVASVTNINGSSSKCI
jgi:hypothetical protein